VHPLLKNLRCLAAYLLAWMLAGCALAAAWVQQAPTEWLWVLGFLLPVALFTGMAALSMYAVCRSFPLRPASWMSTLSRRAAAAGLLALLVSGAAALWNASHGPAVGSGRVGHAHTCRLARRRRHADRGIRLVRADADALLAQQTIHAAAEAQARLLAREMENKALRKQLDPHFLSNSLNSISSLIQFDPAAARAMTVNLAQFFRQTLSLGERERIRLDEELDACTFGWIVVVANPSAPAWLESWGHPHVATHWMLVSAVLRRNSPVPHVQRDRDRQGCSAVHAEAPPAATSKEL
jgi:hypothetical protein